VLLPINEASHRMSPVGTVCEVKTEEVSGFSRNLPLAVTDSTHHHLSSEGREAERTTFVQDLRRSVAGENAANAEKLRASVSESEYLNPVKCADYRSSLDKKNCNIIPDSVNRRKRSKDAVITFRVSAKCSGRAANFFTSQVYCYLLCFMKYDLMENRVLQ
jgi:hypothetical protein